MSKPEQKTITASPFDGVRPDMLLMFKEAQQKGLWFFADYIGQWWSPEELAIEQRAGLDWVKSEFQLRDPMERLAELQKIVGDEQERLERFVARLKRSKKRNELPSPRARDGST